MENYLRFSCARPYGITILLRFSPLPRAHETTKFTSLMLVAHHSLLLARDCLIVGARVATTSRLVDASRTTEASGRRRVLCRLFSSSSGNKNYQAKAKTVEWRKQQLDKLEQKFEENTPTIVTNDEDLQPMWKQMESRVRGRRPRTLADTKGLTGRQNVRKTDEDVWLREGLYDGGDDETKEEQR